MNTVVLAENAADPDTWEYFENIPNVPAFLKEQYKEGFPENGKIYHGGIAQCYDVTPNDTGGVKKLFRLNGTFYVTQEPEFFLFGLTGIFGTLLKVIIIGVLLYLVTPKPPKPRNQRAQSPNNDLSERTNEIRIESRIPDIFGTVRSTPDLIAVSYKIYENHKEIEHSFMCIGRGEYEVSDIRDDTTKLEDIAGSTCEIYKPFTSPNSGDSPQLQIGDTIADDLLSAKRYNSVTGQVLRAPNENKVNGANNIIFKYPDQIEVLENTDINFLDYFDKGDEIEVTKATYSAGASMGFPGGSVNLNGTYEILSVDSNFLALVNPANVNSDWDNLPIYYPEAETGTTSANIETDSPQWVGPFILDDDDLTQVFVNVVCAQGLFKDNGENQSKEDVEVELELTPIDSNDEEIGPPETFQDTIFGSRVTTSLRAVTLKANPTFNGRCKARMRRTSNTKLDFEGTVVDETKWQDVYSMSAIDDNDFGNITTVRSSTLGGGGALSIKERKLNMQVTRKVPVRGNRDGNYIASNRIDDIFTAICVDPKIGNRITSEIDINGVYNTVGEIRGYFGSDKAIEFGHTFDDENLSFEETITSVADTMFCKAYRQGNVIKIKFEKQTIDSILLFNHRNKLPDTEKRSVIFGNQDDNDGVELEYRETESDSIISYFVPEDRSALNPKKIESVGIRSKLLARFHAYRLYNKITNQNIATEFESTSEAALLILHDRVLVADNTRSDTQDGEVYEQTGLVLTLSRPVTFEENVDYTIFLQLPDGTLDTMTVTEGSNSRAVILERAPLLPLSVDDDNYAHSLFWIVKNDDVREQAFLITERELKEKGTFNIRAINYTDNYYSNDKDFINGVVNEDGNEIEVE